LVFNLPTEAQWEYACRAGIATALNSDKNLTDKNTCPRMAEVGRYAWNGGNQGYAAPASDTAWGTAKVGSYLPNQWGLYDMHGNVIEWCLDWFVDGYPEESVTDPEGAERGTYRVCRGGAWTKDAHYCRSAQRSYFGPTNSGSNFYGFRIAMMAP
jgi:formylglycine-generating enzyme required for sulfatase activity